MSEGSAADLYDVVIAGAGMVGAACAGALSAADLRIAVVEPKAPAIDWPGDSTDLRVSAVTLASRQIFSALDAWDAMTAQRVSPFREMYVWDAGGDGRVHFDCAATGQEAMGYIIENRVIQRALLERLQHRDNVMLHCPAGVSSLTVHDRGVVVGLDTGAALTARVVIGADGAESKVRRLAGIPVQRRDYMQKAVVSTVTTALPHRETAWQRFLPTGPLAFLPLWDGRSSIVWSTAPPQAERLCAMDENAFNRELETAFDGMLGAVRHSGPRAAFPLRRQHADRYTAQRLALIGDAAHTVHPLAGQGVNLGLLDAAALAEVIIDAHGAGRDIGAATALRRYERWRKGDNLLMMSALDAFKHLFGTALWPVALARNLGMSCFDHAGPIKERVMLHAMGLKGDLPRLAR